ncbi:hypothetical protein ACSAZK_03360 [Methanosarcina sp. Mfa9]
MGSKEVGTKAKKQDTKLKSGYKESIGQKIEIKVKKRDTKPKSGYKVKR